MDNRPLAEILRPLSLEKFVGQEHLIGKEGIIRKLLNESGRFPSLILWGPPGSGKTTLARIIANELGFSFQEFSAVNASIKDIGKVLQRKKENDSQMNFLGKESLFQNQLIFIDEIHRFNKAQQDFLLPFVEKGELILIGATTENPSFEVIGPLLSRCRVLILKQLSEENLSEIILRGLKKTSAKIEKESLNFLAMSSNGDARIALNVLEISQKIAKSKEISLKDIEEALQKRQLIFDLKGEEYYNTISALHKSIRASDPDASLYWLARILESGQDPLYVARRLIRASAEDIGLADPQALVLANSAFDACNKLGMPECNVILAELVVYLAKSPKSNKLYLAYGEAAGDVHKFGNLPVPMHIRNPVTKLMKEAGYGKKIPNENYLPEKLKGKKYILD